MFVRLTKLTGKFNPEWHAHKFGGPTPNLPEGYVAEGELIEPLEIGKPLLVRRVKRSTEDGIVIEATGYFTSSPVTNIKMVSGYSLVDTENSTYKVEALS